MSPENGSPMHSIPTTLLQVSPKPIDERVVSMSMRFCPGWTYEHFDDARILEYFEQHPVPECPDIIEKFHSFSHGAHKADLFRYYYLYLNGGVYLDSDAVLEAPIEDITKDYHFVSINGYHEHKNLIFNGFLVCTAKHPIMREALLDAYAITDNQLKNDYHLICKNLHSIVADNSQAANKVHIYQEERVKEYFAGVRTYDDNRQLLITHYCYLRRVPGHAMTWIRHLYPFLFGTKFNFKIYRALQKVIH